MNRSVVRGVVLLLGLCRVRSLTGARWLEPRSGYTVSDAYGVPPTVGQSPPSAAGARCAERAGQVALQPEASGWIPEIPPSHTVRSMLIGRILITTENPWYRQRSDGAMPPSEPGPTLAAPFPPAYESMREAIERGRAGRGGRAGPAWSQLRALVLAYAAQGMLRSRIGGILGLSTQRVTQLREEGCDAVLRGGLESAEAETACADRWRRWCAAGDADACARVPRSLGPSSA